MSNRVNKNYDQRQYALMIARIDDYRHGHIGIEKLVNDLEALIDVLEEVSEDWRSLLYSNWGILEEVYAVALDQEVTTLSQADNSLIAEGLNILEKMINDELGRLKQNRRAW